MTEIAVAAYALQPLESRDAYAAKITRWVARAADAGAKLLVFPEFGAVELLHAAGAEATQDPAAALNTLARQALARDALAVKLCQAHDLYILSAPGPVPGPKGPTLRATLVGPKGRIGAQDRLVLTRREKALGLVPGESLQLYRTEIGRFAIAGGYDLCFPALVRQMLKAGAQVLLAPGYAATEQEAQRLEIAARARAQESQLFVAQSMLVGGADWSPLTPTAHGNARLIGPGKDGEIEDIATLDPGARGWAQGRTVFPNISRALKEGPAPLRNDAKDVPNLDAQIIEV